MPAQAGPEDGWGESESCVGITGLFEQELVLDLSGIRGLISVRHGLTLAGDFVGDKDTLACAHHKLEDRDGSSCVSEPLSDEFTAIHIFIQFCSEYIPSWDRG